MDNLFSTPPVLVSFGQVYEQNIASRLREIDLFLKTTDCPYNVPHIAELLGMPVGEVTEIIKAHHIDTLNKLSFFTIVAYSTSYICRLIQRQWKYANTPFYTPSIVAYIYELNPYKVQAAFEKLGRESILESELRMLFDFISTPIFIP
ncbi:MAG: hypothetical protein ACRCWY_11400 [Cellulosilyticaceae bacterium]